MLVDKMIMKPNHKLSFKVGQQAEAKSFLVGYRSAWFRCKIKSKLQRGGHTLEYFDFPDEKESWTELYKQPKQGSKIDLMVRPPFPPFYRESQLPDSYPESDVIAIASDTWKVGDLVDWWTDSSYWSATVIELLGKDKVKVELPKPPIGEGKSYTAFCKDLRPSLDWSPENGWTVPLSRDDNNCWRCARLIQTHNQDEDAEYIHSQLESTTDEDAEDMHTQLESTTDVSKRVTLRRSTLFLLYFLCKTWIDVIRVWTSAKKMIFLALSYYSFHSFSTNVVRQRDDMAVDIQLGNPTEETPDSESQGVKDAVGLHAKVPSEKSRQPMTPQKEMHIHRSIDESIDGSILELEELAMKIRYLKGVLANGYQWSNAMKPSWKILLTGDSNVAP